MMTPDQERISQAFKAKAADLIDKRLQDVFDRYTLKPGDKMDLTWTIDLSCTLFCHSDETVSVEAEKYLAPPVPPAVEACYSIKSFLTSRLAEFLSPDTSSVVFGEIVKTTVSTKVHFILCIKGLRYEHTKAWTLEEMENDSITARITRELQSMLTTAGFLKVESSENL